MEGNTTLTYRFKIVKIDKYTFLETKKVYCQLVLDYFNVLISASNRPSSNFELLRLVEIECKKRFDKDNKVNSSPLYFRRAAINQAIGSYKSYLTRLESNNDIPLPESFDTDPVFYKGQYRDLKSDSIAIKLFDGKCWKFVTIEYYGRELPNDAVVLAPKLELDNGNIYLTIPFKTKVSDISTTSERINKGEKVGSVAFSSGDYFGVVTDGENYLYLKGAAEYKAKIKRLVGLIRKKQEEHNLESTALKKDWIDVSNQLDHHAHLISDSIVTFFVNNNVKVIAIEEKKYNYLSKDSPLFIVSRILKYIEYKAFKNGIVCTKVKPSLFKNKCSICSAKGYVTGHSFICSNGHKQNQYLNQAKNNIFACLRKFNK